MLAPGRKLVNPMWVLRPQADESVKKEPEMMIIEEISSNSEKIKIVQEISSESEEEEAAQEITVSTREIEESSVKVHSWFEKCKTGESSKESVYSQPQDFCEIESNYSSISRSKYKTKNAFKQQK
jgi:hypothetical protein